MDLTLPILQIIQACCEEIRKVVPEINALGFYNRDIIMKNGGPKTK